MSDAPARARRLRRAFKFALIFLALALVLRGLIFLMEDAEGDKAAGRDHPPTATQERN